MTRRRFGKYKVIRHSSRKATVDQNLIKQKLHDGNSIRLPRIEANKVFTRLTAKASIMTIHSFSKIKKYPNVIKSNRSGYFYKAIKNCLSTEQE